MLHIDLDESAKHSVIVAIGLTMACMGDGASQLSCAVSASAQAQPKKTY